MMVIGRLVLIITLMAAPWPFGSVTSEPLFLLCSAVGLLVFWQFLYTVGSRQDHPFHLPTVAVAPVGLMLVATLQLLPVEKPLIPDMQHAVLSDLAQEFTAETPTAGTVSPVTTRTQASKLYFALAGFCLGVHWFSTPGSLVWLWRALAVNGACLAFFGIVQKVTWDGLLFWSVPLRQGGTPFASFVNRNNAAGYLNLCLAAGLGCLIFKFGGRAVSSLGPGQTGGSRLPWRVRVLRRLASLDALTLALFGAVMLIASAVLFSLSRGGILAMVIGFFAVVLFLRGRLRISALAVGLLLSAAAVGTLAWLGGGHAIQERLNSLGDPAAAAEGRLLHWWDTSGAIHDFPILGTGLGTYRFANLPYQVHNSVAWYVNADNHFFEILVETGFVGLVFYLSGFLLAVLAASSLIRRDRPELRVAGVAGLFVVATQAAQAFTDFGLLIPANALTFAVLTGSLCGTACAAANFHRLNAPLWLGLARLESRLSRGLLFLVLSLASGAFGFDMWTATQAASAGNIVIDIDPADPLKTNARQFDIAIERGQQALKLRPGDPELHRTIGLWWINRYRVAAANELSRMSDPPDRLKGRQLWKATSTRILSSRVLTLVSQGDQQKLGRLRQLPLVQDNLLPAKTHLQLAWQSNPLGRDVAARLADLWFLTEGQSNDWDTSELGTRLGQEIFAAPSAASDLFSAAQIAREAGLEALADRTFRRCLEISDEHILPVWSVISQNRPVEILMERVLPKRLEVFLTVAEYTSDDLVKNSLVFHAEGLLNAGGWEDNDGSLLFSRARLSELRGEIELAIRQYRQSFDNTPEYGIEPRLRLAKLLIKEQRYDEAEAELTWAVRIAPDRTDVMRHLKELREPSQTLEAFC